MQVCGNYYRNKIGLCLFHHFAVIREAYHMKPAHGMLQVRFVGFRNTYELNLLGEAQKGRADFVEGRRASYLQPTNEGDAP